MIRLSTSENNELQTEPHRHANTVLTVKAGLALMREKNNLKGSFGRPLCKVALLPEETESGPLKK